MKKLIILSTLILLPLSAISQTPAEVLTSHNNGVCIASGLAVGCNDAAVLAAYCSVRNPCVDERTADAKVYPLTVAGRDAFRDGVILPGRYDEVFNRRANTVIEQLNQMVTRKHPRYDAAKCAVIMTAAGLDVSVCK